MPLLLLACGVAGALSAPAGHEILELPGWPGKLPSRHFSGYIDAGRDVQNSTAGLGRAAMSLRAALFY
jgi:hypothetical protein